MYFMLENRVQDCCGWEAFGCHMLAAKAVLVASMQETAKLLVPEENWTDAKPSSQICPVKRRTMLVENLGFSLAK